MATVELDRKDSDKGDEVDVRVDSAAAVDGEVVNPDQVPLGVASEEDQVPFRAEKLDELVLAVGVVDEEETAESGDGSVTGCAVLGLKGVLPPLSGPVNESGTQRGKQLSISATNTGTVRFVPPLLPNVSSGMDSRSEKSR